MLVRDAMTYDVVTVAPHDSAWTAADILARLEITGLPVIEPDRRVVGLITEMDLIRALRRGDDLRRLTVADIMTELPKFVEEETDLDTASGLMEEWQVRRLPVCRQGLLTGVVSRGDVLRCMLTQRLHA